MKTINPEAVQSALNDYVDQDVYIHLETTNGAYAAHFKTGMVIGAYIRNSLVRFSRGTIAGKGPYRVGLKMDLGWIYAEGLTDWEIDHAGRLLLAGHDEEGRIAVALQLSKEPF